jgi:hypothetical protein
VVDGVHACFCVGGGPTTGATTGTREQHRLWLYHGEGTAVSLTCPQKAARLRSAARSPAVSPCPYPLLCPWPADGHRALGPAPPDPPAPRAPVNNRAMGSLACVTLIFRTASGFMIVRARATRRACVSVSGLCCAARTYVRAVLFAFISARVCTPTVSGQQRGATF